jgi:hypothetical protein
MPAVRKKINIMEERKWHRYQFIGIAKIRIPKEKISLDSTIANISLSGIGLYTPRAVGIGKRVKLKISFIDNKGTVSEDFVEGNVDWQCRFRNIYLVGVIFNEELNVINQPKLVKHLAWLIDTFKWPSPFSDRRIATL